MKTTMFINGYCRDRKSFCAPLEKVLAQKFAKIELHFVSIIIFVGSRQSNIFHANDTKVLKINIIMDIYEFILIEKSVVLLTIWRK